MTDSRWRRVAAPIITRVLEETRGKTEREVRAALRDAYPFGQRKYHPYRIWCDEVARQRGTKRTPERKRREQSEEAGQLLLGEVTR